MILGMTVSTIILEEFGWILREIQFKLMEGEFYMMKARGLIIGTENIKMDQPTMLTKKEQLG
jgi:hypothetical protein